MSDLINRDPMTFFWAVVIIIMAVLILCGFALARDRDRPGTRLGYGRRSDDREYGFGDGEVE